MSPSDPPVAAPTPHELVERLRIYVKFLEDREPYRDREGILTDLRYELSRLDRVAAPTPETPSLPTASREFAALERLEQPPYSEPEWYRHAQGISPKAIEAVRAFFRYAWSVVPCMDGGIQLERHNLGFDMEIRFDADGRCDEAYAELAGAVSHPQPDPKC